MSEYYKRTILGSQIEVLSQVKSSIQRHAVLDLTWCSGLVVPVVTGV